MINPTPATPWATVTPQNLLIGKAIRERHDGRFLYYITGIKEVYVDQFNLGPGGRYYRADPPESGVALVRHYPCKHGTNENPFANVADISSPVKDVNGKVVEFSIQ